MKKVFNSTTYLFFMVSLIIFLITGCSKKSNKIDNLTLDNFYQVSDELYRSGQPTKSQMQQLDEFGIRTVINLRAIHSDRDEIEETKLKSHWVRMRAGNITDKKVINVLKLINESPKPILVHCWHGSDRTGVVIAMYRMVFQNWPKQEAIDELMKPEYGYHYNYYPNIIKYIQNVDIDNIRRHVFDSNKY